MPWVPFVVVEPICILCRLVAGWRKGLKNKHEHAKKQHDCHEDKEWNGQQYSEK